MPIGNRLTFYLDYVRIYTILVVFILFRAAKGQTRDLTSLYTFRTHWRNIGNAVLKPNKSMSPVTCA